MPSYFASSYPRLAQASHASRTTVSKPISTSTREPSIVVPPFELTMAISSSMLFPVFSIISAEPIRD